MKREFLRIAAFVLHWFVRFPVIGAIATAFVAVLAFGGGRAFGLPDLFWHQVLILKLMLIGFSTAIVLFLVCIVGFLLESEDTDCSLPEYVTGTYPLLFLCVVVGTFRTVREPDDVSPWWLLLGHLAGIVFAIVTTWFLIQIAKRLIAHPVVDRAYARASRASPEKRWLHVYASVVIVGFFLVYAILALAMPRWLPSAVAICLIFCIVLLIYGFVRFQFPHERIVVTAALIVAMAIAAIVTPYKHRFPALDPLYQHPIAIPPIQSPLPANHLIANDAVREKWLSIVPPATAKPKLAIIATSGGGIRAAVWTTAVLNALTTGPYRIPSFPYHVRVMTGASGGMVGAAYFAASVPQPFVQLPMTSVSKTVERKLPPMADDSLEPVARSLALRDLPGMLAFWSFRDRGSALEQAWSQHAPGVMDTPFSALAIGEREGWRPSLIFTPMLVEDGRRLLVSNLDLDFMLENRGPQSVYSRPSVDLFRLIPAAQSMPVAAAARMSASFPYVTPAAELPTIPRRHVVDAGYWDNFGVHTAV
ncbi:MAG TPA: patatin-like phospholipase family protein, partial [Thermoanaerobaculia bacterium]